MAVEYSKRSLSMVEGPMPLQLLKSSAARRLMIHGDLMMVATLKGNFLRMKKNQAYLNRGEQPFLNRGASSCPRLLHEEIVYPL
jgi:hypothetical protein